ncbi:MAG: glycosyltransferase [Isosphaeraceae bacterium]
MSRVDVFVPCYNYARFLRECVESVLAQPVDLRVLIIDDSSSDETPEVAAALASEDRRVEYRRHAVNRGHIATYNEGLEWATGDYVALLSADDLLTGGSLARASQFLDAHSEAGFVYGKVIRWSVEEPRPFFQDRSLDNRTQCTPGSEWIERVCSRGFTITCPEVLVRTKLQKQLGGYRADLPQWADHDMWFRLASRGDVGYIDEYQAYYRLHGGNMHSEGDPQNKHFRGLRDYEQSYQVYRTLFDKYLDPSVRNDTMRDLVFRRLAENAVWDASAEIDQDRAESARKYLSLALQSSPAISSWPPFLRTRFKIAIGSRARGVALPLWRAMSRCRSYVRGRGVPGEA